MHSLRITDTIMLCSTCGLTLREPFIHCTECKAETNICLQCFTLGRQTGKHLNYHNYEIKSLSFTLYDKKWSAREELCLLDATEELGFGNWNEISKKVETKSHDECEKHFLKYYVDQSLVLPEFSVGREKCYRRPFRLNERNYRPTPETASTDDFLFHSGYMAARADFHTEPDNFAESDLKSVVIETNIGDDEEEHELKLALNVAIADIYYSKLKQRQVRKDVLRDYGLLDIASKSVPFKNGREERVVRDNLKKTTRLLKPDDHEQLVQSILYQKKLEFRVQQLQEYRSVGLKTFRDVSMYKRFKKQRKLTKPKTKLLDEALLYKENPLACQVWLQRQLSRNKSVPTMPLMPPLNRKHANPLDLNGAPSYEKLTDAERELCSSIRLLPEQYFECRNTLQKESYLTNGTLKLQTARDILKIDVNKTRRIYNFCLDQGIIKASV